MTFFEEERDKEYVETRNHTFNQHRNTQNDLATLGKYGEKVPYIPDTINFEKDENVSLALNTGAGKKG